MARRTLVPQLLFLFATQCSPPSLDATPVPDASRWFDVALPELAVPDGWILTQLTVDGGVAAVEPSVTDCPDADEIDSGVADGESDVASVADGSPLGTRCTAPLAPGDLFFDEVMISSVAGSSDRGQWLEVRSSLSCSVDLVGLSASAPHGATARTLDVTSDVWLPPHGYFVIADTLDPTENNDLPGVVFAWTGSPADALHKTSDTITMSMGTVMLDTLTYPDKKRATGTSLSFPLDCPLALRTDFTSWAPSTDSWTPGFFGTPGAPNSDVTCAIPSAPAARPCTAGAQVRRR